MEDKKLKIVTDNTNYPKDLVLDDSATLAPVEAASQEPEQESMEQHEQPQETEQIQQPVKETRNAQNFRALKAETERIARERDEAKALIAQYEAEKKSRQLNVPVAPALDYEDEDLSLANDDYAQGAHVKKLAKQMKAMKQELEASKQEAQLHAVRASLIAEHPDYQKVVSTQNLRALELTYPHLARAINMNDPYNAGKACYDLIKQFGIDAEETSKTEVTKALIKENLSKPKPGVSVQGTKNANTSPMGRASEFYEGPLTDEMKKIFYQELKDAMNSGRR